MEKKCLFRSFTTISEHFWNSIFLVYAHAKIHQDTKQNVTTQVSRYFQHSKTQDYRLLNTMPEVYVDFSFQIMHGRGLSNTFLVSFFFPPSIFNCFDLFSSSIFYSYLSHFNLITSRHCQVQSSTRTSFFKTSSYNLHQLFYKYTKNTLKF